MQRFFLQNISHYLFVYLFTLMLLREATFVPVPFLFLVRIILLGSLLPVPP